MIAVITHIIALGVGIGIGAYGWYRFGSTLATDAQKIRTAIK